MSIRSSKKWLVRLAASLLLGSLVSTAYAGLFDSDQPGYTLDDLIWKPGSSGTWNFAMCESSWGADNCSYSDGLAASKTYVQVGSVNSDLNDKISSVVVCNNTGKVMRLYVNFWQDSNLRGSEWTTSVMTINNETCTVNNEIRNAFNDKASSYTIMWEAI